LTNPIDAPPKKPIYTDMHTYTIQILNNMLRVIYMTHTGSVNRHKDCRHLKGMEDMRTNGQTPERHGQILERHEHRHEDK